MDKQQILQIITSYKDKFLEKEQLFERLEAVTDKQKAQVSDILSQLEAESLIVINKRGRLSTPEKCGFLRGKALGTGKGYIFVNVEGVKDDYYIPTQYANYAMHKDSVFIRELGTKNGNNKKEAEIVKVIERYNKQVVGRFVYKRKYSYLMADEVKLSDYIYIPNEEAKGAKDGDTVVAEIIEYPSDKGFALGKITEILKGSDFEVLKQIIVRSNNLRSDFPQSAEEEAESVNKRVTAKDIRNRTDFRDETVITIDGEDARDFDDAVRVVKHQNGYTLQVHIADVAHYVTEGSALDKEAYRRGTSVYFPESVINMLPLPLSNGICSLKPNEDRLTLSCVMEFDNGGNLKDYKIVEGVIKSAHRMTYTLVTQILVGAGLVPAQYKNIAADLLNMKELAELLIAKREKSGMIDLDIKEAKITVEKGKINICAAPREISHRIIEMFMIAANETIAQHFNKLKIPFVYRIHEKPSEEKINGFYEYTNMLGLKVKKTKNIQPKDLQAILESVKKTEYYDLINKTLLRSMQKAKYSDENLGHFGLASKYYCHFTSPIRRYPDLSIHRIIKDYLRGTSQNANYKLQITNHKCGTVAPPEFPSFGGVALSDGVVCKTVPTAPLNKKYKDFVKKSAVNSSITERAADEAERDMDDLYKAVYMQKHTGEAFDAKVSGLNTFGIFAELDNTVEGLIRAEHINYRYDEDKGIAKLNGKVIRLGNKIKIFVMSVNVAARKIEFGLA